MHSEFESQVIARIRQWLADNEWTAFSLARSVGVSPSYAQRILSGKLRGSTRVLSALASAAGLGWGDLVDIVRGYADDERGAVWVGQRRFKRRHLPR